ncbi:MAG: ROK family protein, partial [Bacteroidota bacterium]
MDTDYRFGIDLGGTKIEGVVLDTSGKVHTRNRIATKRSKGYEHILERIALMIATLEQSVGQTAETVGVGTPGAKDPDTGLMKNCNTTVLNDKPLDSDLSKKTGKIIQLANDANCFAVAETQLGVIKDQVPNAKVVFGIIMGTGVGGGLVIDGKPWAGRQGIGGEWGHSFLDQSGGQCYCGK